MFKAAVEHAADSHASQKVKLRLCRLDPLSGTFKHVSKEYNVTPAAVRAEGNHIVAHQDNTITVEHKSEEQVSCPSEEQVPCPSEEQVFSGKKYFLKIST